MAQIRTRPPGGATPGKRTQASGARAAKVAITVRLDAARAKRLQAIAEAENRTLTNYVETALIRDLESRDEAARGIMMYVAPGASDHVEPDEIVRGPGESDEAYARRRTLVAELWSIPDNA